MTAAPELRSTARHLPERQVTVVITEVPDGFEVDAEMFKAQVTQAVVQGFLAQRTEALVAAMDPALIVRLAQMQLVGQAVGHLKLLAGLPL